MTDRPQPSSVDPESAGRPEGASPARLAVPRPGPGPSRPTPASIAPRPGPPRRPAGTAGPSGADAGVPSEPSAAEPLDAAAAARAAEAATFGRVDDDGTVYVRTGQGERAVGQMPDTPPEEALAFYTRRYEALAVTVELLEKRVRAGAIAPDEAAHTIKKEKAAIREASAVGDLDGLLTRLQELAPHLEEQRAARRAEKAEQTEATRRAKEGYVAQAEKLAAGNDWRGGVNKFRDLLEKWKELPRIDKTTDDELWHRFSTARTTYTRRRKAQFAEQAGRREEAATAKKRIIAEAEKLADSTEWGPTSGAFRDLMTRWKEAGPAPREVDDELWATFRGLQDRFFEARTKANAEQDAEFAGNLEAKQALLDTYEPQITPEQNIGAAKRAYRELLDQWAEIGKVPRDSIRSLDARLRALETSIKKVEDERWKKTNPEARARAEDTAGKLRDQIDSYEAKAAKAEARGDDKAAREARQAAETYRSWLQQAEAAAADFRG